MPDVTYEEDDLDDNIGDVEIRHGRLQRLDDGRAVAEGGRHNRLRHWICNRITIGGSQRKLKSEKTFLKHHKNIIKTL